LQHHHAPQAHDGAANMKTMPACLLTQDELFDILWVQATSLYILFSAW